MSALILIDLRQAIDDRRFGMRNNPKAEQRVVELLTAWRKSGRLIVHIRHDSLEPDSPFRPGQFGNDSKPEAKPLPGTLVIAKQTAQARCEIEAMKNEWRSSREMNARD
jgi:nicotinamidase-related amidase